MLACPHSKIGSKSSGQNHMLFGPYKARTGSLYKLENLNHSKMPDFQVYVNPKNEVTYPASCHCGKSRFTVTIPSLDTIMVTSCNCSICQINGYLNIHPLRKNVSFQSPGIVSSFLALRAQEQVEKFFARWNIARKLKALLPYLAPWKGLIELMNLLN